MRTNRFLTLFFAIFMSCGASVPKNAQAPQSPLKAPNSLETDLNVTVVSPNGNEGNTEQDGTDGASREVTLGPGPTFTNDTLVTTVSGFGDGHGDFLIFRWFINGMPITDATEASLPGWHFERDDEVYVEANRTNGPADQPWVRSNTVVIANAPPVIESVAIAPGNYSRASTLTGSATAVDPDGDDVTISYTWLVAEKTVAAGTSLEANGLHRGDVVTLAVIPYDGDLYGPSISSSPVIIQNTPPSVSSVTLRIPVGASDNLHVDVAGWSDLDGDSPGCQCEWFINGSIVVGEWESTLSRQAVRQGDEVLVRYVPFDGIETGTAEYSNVVAIPNARPTAPVIEIAPAEVTLTTGVIWVKMQEPSVDIDGDPIRYTYSWSKNNVPQDFPESQTSVISPFGSNRDVWSAIVTPYDDAGPGEQAFASRSILFEAVGVTTGQSHTCAASSFGAIYCWGNNTFGQLGDGTRINSFLPVAVKGLQGGVLSLSATALGTCALMVDGSVYCWGQVSLSDTVRSTVTPVRVPDLPPVRNIDGGTNFSCGVTFENSVMCWGANGNWREMDRHRSYYGVEEAGRLTESIADVAAGFVHICVLLESGQVKCMGNGNLFGQLGDGTEVPHYDFREASLPGPAIALEANASSSCALVSGGKVYCWGAQTVGGKGFDYLVPTPVTLPVEAVEVAVGVLSACARLAGGSVSCWGDNMFAELGQGHHRALYQVVGVPALDHGVTALSMSDLHACALTQGGSLLCWGENHDGQLGIGSSIQTRPVPVTGRERTMAVATGEWHSCTTNIEGIVQCFGNNEGGQLGHNSTIAQWVPVDVPQVMAPIQNVWAGYSRTCAGAITGQLVCWGKEPWVSRTDNSIVRSMGLPAAPIQVLFGNWYSCAVLTSGAMYCWGSFPNGQLTSNGNSYNTTSATPVLTAQNVEQASAGSGFVCTLTGGWVRCWGGGSEPVGIGGTPHNVTGFSAPVSSIAAGWNSLCALLNNGGVQCLGQNSDGILGIGTSSSSSVPVSIRLSQPAIRIASGYSHACAILVDGSVECWGQSYYGQLGDGSDGTLRDPVHAGPLEERAIAISANYRHTCAVLESGKAMCWGESGDGRLGNENITDQSPHTVIGFRFYQ